MIKVSDIPSCCCGKQFQDFPGAHGITSPSDAYTVKALVAAMRKNTSSRFLIAYVNSNQNLNMEKIFRVLGWKLAKNINNYLFVYIYTMYPEKNKINYYKIMNRKPFVINSVFSMTNVSYFEKINEEIKKERLKLNRLKTSLRKNFKITDFKFMD